MLMKLGGMRTLLSDLYKKEKLSDFETKLFHHVLVKMPTKDELLLRRKI